MPKQHLVQMSNKFLTVYVDLQHGVKAVLDKASGTNYSVADQLVQYATSTCHSAGDAYAFCPKGAATALLGPNATARAATVAFGPVMHEVRLQVSDEHKTRIRLWQSDDPAVGGRLEFAHRIGVLEPHTEVATRWVLVGDNGTNAAAAAAAALTDPFVLYSEDNGYEVIAHQAGTGARRIAANVYPSQMSAFVASSDTMLAVALDRSHGVASLQNGTLEVIQHRRAGPYEGSGGTVVMDDTSRIFTQSWMAVGARQDANRQRVAMRQRLNHPLVLASAKFNATAAAAAATAAAPLGVTALPENVHLQSVRATSAANDALLVRLQHLYTDGEDAAMSLPLTVDPLALLQPARADLAAAAEVTLDGMRAVATLANRTRFPAEGGEEQRGVAPAPVPAAAAAVPVGPFELRTFRLTAA